MVTPVMDLTPPLIRSPASPTHTYCPSEPSSLDYPSPGIATQQYKLTSLYAAGQSCSMGQAAGAGTSLLTPTNSSTAAEWGLSSVMAPASSSLSIPNVLSSEYCTFTDYDPPLPTSYDSEVYPPPPPPPYHSSPMGDQPHSVIDATCRSPALSSSRSSFSYAQGGQSTTSMDPGIKTENTGDYGPGIDVSQCQPPRSIQVPYVTEPGPYGGQHQDYLQDVHSSAWLKSEADGEHDFQGQVLRETATSSHTTKLTERPKHSRPKRTPRQTTSAAHANYQCKVKGCGKLFSRSYNYNAHLETHNQKREYPFPCPITDCNKKFVRKTDLRRHNQSVHMKERNHKCDYCSRLFARKDTLRRHMEDGCSKRFDVGTCDLRIDGFEGMAAINRNIGEPIRAMGQSHSKLPPISTPIFSESGLLHPGSSSSRRRSVVSGTGEGARRDHWLR